MEKIPTLYKDHMISLATQAATAYVSTNEKMSSANVNEFLDVYLDVFTLAHSKLEQRITAQNISSNYENFEDCEKLPNSLIR